MLSPMNASGLPRNSETSIWSSDTPLRSVREAMALSESPRRTRYSSPDAWTVLAAAGAGTGAADLAGTGAGAVARGAGAVRGAAATGAGAGARVAGAGAAEATGAVVGEGAAATRVLGGSNSIVYSRTKRPDDQVASTITSTKGSSTARSLVTRRKGRPSARRSSVTFAPDSTALYSTPAFR